MLDCVWNVMVHAQKPDFVFRRNGRVYLNRRGASVQSTTGSRGVCISGSNAGYTTFRGSMKSTGYPLHSPVSPSLPLPCVTVFHRISTGLYFPCWHCWSELFRSHCADVCTSMSYTSICRTKTKQMAKPDGLFYKIKAKVRVYFL
jgi:hypothetical protein